MIAAITGGRRDEAGDILIPSRHQMNRFLTLILSLNPERVRHGNAIGTDRHVAQFLRECESYRGAIDPFPVLREDGDWPLAGHRRNARMLKTPPAVSVLIAFLGEGGTANCVRTALEMKAVVWQWEGSREEGEFRRISR